MSDKSNVELAHGSGKACALQVGGIRRTRTKSRSLKSIFPHKLWRMVNDQRFRAAIRWTDDGQSFVINENLLEVMCLGKENHLFYTKQPKSFIRQLHLYGFRKVNKNQFTHNYFHRDQPDLLKYIKRSYKPSPANESLPEAENLELAEQQNGYLVTTLSNHTDEVGYAPSCADKNPVLGAINKVDEFDKIIETPKQRQMGWRNETDDFLHASISWYEGNYVDNYNYNEDSILTLYNNDIYPNTYDYNNITF